MFEHDNVWTLLPDIGSWSLHAEVWMLPSYLFKHRHSNIGRQCLNVKVAPKVAEVSLFQVAELPMNKYNYTLPFTILIFFQLWCSNGILRFPCNLSAVCIILKLCILRQSHFFAISTRKHKIGKNILTKNAIRMALFKYYIDSVVSIGLFHSLFFCFRTMEYIRLY